MIGRRRCSGRTDGWKRGVVVAGAATMLAAAWWAPPVTCGGVDAPCAWRVVSTRPAGVGDTAFVDRDPVLAEPEDLRDAPGPDSLRLLNRRAPSGKWGIYLFDQRTGDTTLLAERGSVPRFSPDGRYVAFSLWRSIDRPWNLVILDRKTGRRIEPVLGGCVSAYRRWSPDGRWLAVQSNLCKQSRSRLCLVSLPSGAVRWVDSLDVFAEYEVSWSPDSRHLAVIRPEAIDHRSEEPTVADLWIFTDQGRRRCPLLITPDYVERDPKWVTNNTLLIERHRRDGAQAAAQDRLLLALEGERP